MTNTNMNLRLYAATCVALVALAIGAATPTSNLPISQMPVATNALDVAYAPIIQPYPGRFTNDNFKVSISNLFRGRPNLFVTNLYVSNAFVTNLYVSNLFATNIFVGVTNNTFTNLYVTNLYATTVIQVGGSNVATRNELVWTNDANIVRVVPSYDYVFVTDLFNNGWDVLISKAVALTNGTNVLRTDLYSGFLVDGASATASDALVRLKPGYFQGQSAKIVSPDGANLFTVPSGWTLDGTSGKQILNGDFIGGTNQVLTLEYDGFNWKETGRYVSGGPPPVFGTNYWEIILGDLYPVLPTGSLYLRQGAGYNVYLGDADQWRVNGIAGDITPQSNNSFSVGSETLQVYETYSQNFQSVGYTDGGGVNYSKLKVTHEGTNGPISFYSQSSGDAGAPRPFYFYKGVTNIARLEMDTLGQTYWNIYSSTGARSLFGTSAGGHANVIADTGKNIYLGVNGNGSGDVLLSTTSFRTITNGSHSLGEPAGGWNALVLSGITKVEKSALTPADGMIVYQTDNTPGLRAYINGAWRILDNSADP